MLLVLWDPYTTEQINSLDMVQRRAARFVKRDRRRTSMLTELRRESLQRIPIPLLAFGLDFRLSGNRASNCSSQLQFLTMLCLIGTEIKVPLSCFRLSSFQFCRFLRSFRMHVAGTKFIWFYCIKYLQRKFGVGGSPPTASVCATDRNRLFNIQRMRL